MYSNPEKFRDFVAKCSCLCFTATPDDQDPLGVDAKVLNAMQFKKYHYISNVAEQRVQLDFDKELPIMPNSEKAQ